MSVDLDTEWETGSGSRQPKMVHKKREECHVLKVLNIFLGGLDTANKQAIYHARRAPPSPPSPFGKLSLFFKLPVCRHSPVELTDGRGGGGGGG